MIIEVRRTLNTLNEYTWLGEGFWLRRKLMKVKSFEELDQVNRDIEEQLKRKPYYKPTRSLYSPYKANCLPGLNSLFN